MQTYAVKALREGKAESSWAMPNTAYEEATRAFLARILDSATSSAFLASFEAIARRTGLLGALNSLAQLALKATMPGVPDLYQGTEGWDLSLVDPDNRRPVDFAGHGRALAALPAQPPWGEFAADVASGQVKLALTSLLLARRATSPALFADGAYRPLAVSGPDAAHVLAFARVLRGEAEIVVVARHLARLTGGGRRWPDLSQLDAAVDVGGFGAIRGQIGFRTVGEGAVLPAGAIFDALPVALADGRERGR